ncbi:MAG: twin-arginine translocase TatA/TatE family subunit [Ilumatobacter sp.]|uniref:Sec-independent protein translocase subunit TatA/TatB n=1 Tax=Ilumatobacter sp. TaxID=1967498 RepID=UPI00260FF02F|nr:twin-arginine translocase TatA/TatE family subunit [Ilumatobacter sp.]MDJ0771458.1 twin-arginine translocase TatA/TatE family subunit [Ilumatobacter sp.]
MFNLQGGEIIIILLLALVVLGPEKLPDAMRKAGQFYAELKKMSSGFQQEFRAVVDEPMREVKETANLLRESADLQRLQTGDRAEKPKSAEMGPVDAPEPTEDTPTFEPPDAADDATGEDRASDDGEVRDGEVGAGEVAGAAADDVIDGGLRESDPVTQPPPKPFSSSQNISAAPATRPEQPQRWSGDQVISPAPAESAPVDPTEHEAGREPTDEDPPAGAGSAADAVEEPRE